MELHPHRIRSALWCPRNFVSLSTNSKISIFPPQLMSIRGASSSWKIKNSSQRSASPKPPKLQQSQTKFSRWLWKKFQWVRPERKIFISLLRNQLPGEEIPGDDASPLCLTGETIEISNIECFNCEQLFTEDGFELHACMFDENHQPVVAVDTETEFKKLHRQTMEMLEQNQTKIRELCEKAQGVKPRLDCFKCGRKFVNESGFIRHYEKHIGELVPESPEENAENLRSVILCVICGEVFTAESEVWDHLQSRHVLVFSGVRDCKIRKEAEEKKQEGDVGKCCDAKSNDQVMMETNFLTIILTVL